MQVHTVELVVSGIWKWEIEVAKCCVELLNMLAKIWAVNIGD